MKKKLPLRKIAAALDIDTSTHSKNESGDRKAKREQVAILSKIFSVQEDDLISLWLANKVYNVVKDENVALKAMDVAEQEIVKETKKRKK